MKNKYTILSILACMFVLAACTPDNYELGGFIAPSDIKFSITQNTAKNNIIYLENQTPGVQLYWDYGLGYTNKQKDTILIPFAGNHTVTITAICNGKHVSTTQQVTVPQRDDEYFAHPFWDLLTNGETGKTWTWDDSYWMSVGMTANGHPGPDQLWWGAGVSTLENWGWNGNMTFDIAGGPNYSVTCPRLTATSTFNVVFAKVKDADGNEVEEIRLKIAGSADFLYGQKFVGTNGHDNYYWGCPYDYYVVHTLDANKLVLYRVTPGADEWSGGTIWLFKAVN